MTALIDRARRFRDSTPRVADGRRFAPRDPGRAVASTDPDLRVVRTVLLQQQRRLWLRRIVRRAWAVIAAALLAEVVLWAVARVAPLEAAPVIAVGIPIVAAT